MAFVKSKTAILARAMLDQLVFASRHPLCISQLLLLQEKLGERGALYETEGTSEKKKK